LQRIKQSIELKKKKEMQKKSLSLYSIRLTCLNCCCLLWPMILLISHYKEKKNWMSFTGSYLLDLFG